MYCRKCGCRIPDGVMKCPDCGTNAKGNEYCGGFWGLVGEEKMAGKVADNAFPDESEKDIPELQPLYLEGEEQKISDSSGYRDGSGKQRYKESAGIMRYLPAVLLGGVAIVLIVLFLVQTGKVSALSKELEESSKKVEELQSQIDAGQQIFSGLKLELEEKNNKISELQSQLASQQENSSNLQLELEDRNKKIAELQNQSDTGQQKLFWPMIIEELAFLLGRTGEQEDTSTGGPRTEITRMLSPPTPTSEPMDS